MTEDPTPKTLTSGLGFTNTRAAILMQRSKQIEQVSADKRQFLYLTTTGRKTGKPHKIEIWFVAREGKYYLVSEHGDRSHWVQNLKNDPKISFSVGKDAYRGTGRAINRKNEPELAAKITALMNAKYKWGEGLIVELAPLDHEDGVDATAAALRSCHGVVHRTSRFARIEP